MDKQDFIFWARKLLSSYAPSDIVLQQLSQVDLIAIVGPTGVGKTTIIEQLRLPFVKSDVTRPRRKDENDSKTYNFRHDFDQMITELESGEFVQFYVSEYDEFYGTHHSAYPLQGAAAMSVIAELIEPFSKLGFRSIKPIYIMPPSYAEWMRRIGEVRSEEIKGRLVEAKNSINYAKDHEDVFSFVLNDNLQLAVNDVKAIISGSSPEKRRSDLAQDTVDILLRYLGEA